MATALKHGINFFIKIASHYNVVTNARTMSNCV